MLRAWLVMWVWVGALVARVRTDWAYEGTTFTLAHLNMSYMDQESGRWVSTERIGRFANGAISNMAGVLISGLGMAKKAVYGCTSAPPWEFNPPEEPWVALLTQGECPDQEKIENAFGLNATGVVIYSRDTRIHLRHLRINTHQGSPPPSVVYLEEGEGQAMAGLLQSGVRILVSVSRGQIVKYHVTNTNINRTSVLFVSVSFIILMVISLAWLVFYYVQRFRYIHAKDRLQRHLCNAAKKALNKIPVKHLKASDKEISGDNECCAVCIEPYQVSESVRTLPCKHEFHKNCVDPWLLEHRTCPMCKMDILKFYGYVLSESEESDVLQLDLPDDRGSGGGGGGEGRTRSLSPPRPPSSTTVNLPPQSSPPPQHNTDDIPAAQVVVLPREGSAPGECHRTPVTDSTPVVSPVLPPSSPPVPPPRQVSGRGRAGRASTAGQRVGSVTAADQQHRPTRSSHHHSSTTTLPHSPHSHTESSRTDETTAPQVVVRLEEEREQKEEEETQGGGGGEGDVELSSVYSEDFETASTMDDDPECLATPGSVAESGGDATGPPYPPSPYNPPHPHPPQSAPPLTPSPLSSLKRPSSQRRSPSKKLSDSHSHSPSKKKATSRSRSQSRRRSGVLTGLRSGRSGRSWSRGRRKDLSASTVDSDTNIRPTSHVVTVSHI